MNITQTEIASQPQVWRHALTHVDKVASAFGRPGERVLLLGCGTSAFVAESLADLRESAGLGVTDARYASEQRFWRHYDTVVAITRSGTTTEVLEALRSAPSGIRRVAVTGVADSPVREVADELLVLDYADEQSVVQTRFPSTTVLLARAEFGENVEGLADAAQAALDAPLPVTPSDFDHFVYLGASWAYGLAQEAALKIREAAQAWSESYPLLDYRHGPIAVARPGSLVWIFGPTDPALVEQIRATGATVVTSDDDPLVALVQAQRLAAELAESRGLDPDAPRHLSRSVILGSAGG